jgi:hypothetical protein
MPLQREPLQIQKQMIPASHLHKECGERDRLKKALPNFPLYKFDEAMAHLTDRKMLELANNDCYCNDANNIICAFHRMLSLKDKYRNGGKK